MRRYARKDGKGRLRRYARNDSGEKIMSAIQDFIQALQAVTANPPFTKIFWETQSTHSDTPTFQNLLDEYARYSNDLTNLDAKKALSAIFWEQVQSAGTPIIEERPDGDAAVYFLFPRDRLLDADSESGKRDLYLQGDFHGYGSTMLESQGLERLGSTDIMYRQDTMPRDALVTYYYVQLSPEYSNKLPLELYGNAVLEPLPDTFFPTEAANLVPENKVDHSEEAIALFDKPPNVLIDENARFRKWYDPKVGFFCANPTHDIAHLNLPFEDSHNPNVLYKDFSKLLNKARLNLVSKNNEISLCPEENSDLSAYSRVINVFSPLGDIEQVVVINDGKYYQLGNACERIQALLDEKTAIIFISPEAGLYAEAKAAHVPFEPADDLPGMGVRTVDCKYQVNEYANFIHNNLFPYLKAQGINIPDDSNKRVLVGSSASGTASLYMGLAYPKRFGNVIAQSPSPSNRRILNPLIAAHVAPPPPNIFLGCGAFEGPEHAKNFNLPFAKELEERLGVPLHIYPHGHQMEGWGPELAIALPTFAHLTFQTVDTLDEAKETTRYRNAMSGMRDAEASTVAEDKKEGDSAPSVK